MDLPDAVRLCPALPAASLALALLAPAAPAAAAPAGEPASATARRTLVVGGDRSYPPYEFLDAAGRPSGYCVELTRALARELGLEVEFRLGEWAEVRRGLERGEVDVLQGMSFSEERAREVDFTSPTALVHHSLFAPDGTAPRALAELAGQRVLVLRGGIMHDTLLRRHPEVMPVPAETHAELLRRLSAGEAPFGLMAKLPGLWLIRELRLSGVGPVGPPVSAERYGYAVRKGNAELAGRLEAGLARLRESGAYQGISDSWLGVLEPRGMTWREVLRYGAVVFVPLLLWLAGLAAWSASLRRQVQRRSAELNREIAERRHAEEELRRNEQQLVQADKLAALGALVAGVARGVDGPNDRMLAALPVLEAAWRDATPALEERFARQGDFALGGMRWSRMRQEVPRILEDMQGSARRVRRIAEDLHGFARPAAPEAGERVELDEVARTALRLLEGLVKKSTARLELDLPAGRTPVRGSASRIEQVAVNLVMNACQALPDPSRAIAVRTFADPGRRAACLEVRDEGVGVPAEHLARLADPFFTTKRERGGTGLGLSVSAGIAQEHGGWLQFESEPGRGTTARLWLPLALEAAPEAAPEATPS